MRVKNLLFSLGWLEIWLQLRLGRPTPLPIRRYRPATRDRLGRVRNQLLHQLADTFSPDRPS